jgi:hypothetical protein
MRAPKTPRKKTAFVPRALFRVAITGAGVIPFCVTASATSLQGCGGGGGPCSDADCSVAALCFTDAGKQVQCGLMGVADASFSDAKTDHEGGSLLKDGVADTGFSDSVAADAFGPG